MRIKLASVLVDDQDKALKFYTEVLGFVKKTIFTQHRCYFFFLLTSQSISE